MKKPLYWLALGTLVVTNSLSAAQYSCGANEGGREPGRFQRQGGPGYQQRGEGYRDGGERGDFREERGDRNDYRVRTDFPRNYNGARFDEARGGDERADYRNERRGEFRREFARDLLSQIKNVDIHIDDKGVMTISGTIDTEQARQELKERLRRSIQGIRNINDKLEVKNSDQGSYDRNDNNDQDRGNRNDRNDRNDSNNAGSSWGWGSSNAGAANNDNNTNSDTKSSGWGLWNSGSKDNNSRSNDESRNAQSGQLSMGSANANSNDADGAIMLNVQNLLKPGTFSKGYDRVTFDVANGKVTLKGSVDSESDRKSIMEKAAEIEGVNSVDNQIKVQPVPKTSSY